MLFERAPFHEDGLKEEFLAMTFVHGPEEASFLDEKPAKLRFFLGYANEFAPGDGSNQVKVTLRQWDSFRWRAVTHRSIVYKN